MNNKKIPQNPNTGIKKKPNAGSAAFNEGIKQEPDYNDGVADGPEHPEKISKEKQNPKTKIRKGEE